MSKLKKIMETRISNLNATYAVFSDMGNEKQAKIFKDKSNFLQSILDDANVVDEPRNVGLRE